MVVMPARDSVIDKNTCTIFDNTIANPFHPYTEWERENDKGWERQHERDGQRKRDWRKKAREKVTEKENERWTGCYYNRNIITFIIHYPRTKIHIVLQNKCSFFPVCIMVARTVRYTRFIFNKIHMREGSITAWRAKTKGAWQRCKRTRVSCTTGRKENL